MFVLFKTPGDLQFKAPDDLHFSKPDDTGFRIPNDLHYYSTALCTPPRKSVHGNTSDIQSSLSITSLFFIRLRKAAGQ